MEPFKLDFTGLGSHKAGTTWVAACLQEHPQICMSEPKELNYFCNRTIWKDSVSNRDRGPGWFQKRFKSWTPGQLRGEFSVNYLFDPDSPSIIHQHSEDIKLIACVRNPADRLFSLFQQFCNEYKGADPNDFESFIKTKPDFLSSGLYYDQLQRYYDTFPRENIRVIVFDDIKAQPLQVLRDLFRFLNVDETIVPDSAMKRINERKRPKSHFVRDAINVSKNILNSSPSMKRIKSGLSAIGVEALTNRITRLNLEAGDSGTIKDLTRRMLVEYYGRDVEQLAALLNRDLSSWSQL